MYQENKRIAKSTGTLQNKGQSLGVAYRSSQKKNNIPEIMKEISRITRKQKDKDLITRAFFSSDFTEASDDMNKILQN